MSIRVLTPHQSASCAGTAYLVRRARELSGRFVPWLARFETLRAYFDQQADGCLFQACDHARSTGLAFQEVVGRGITVLEAPDLAGGARPSAILARLRILHRMSAETLVLVEGVRGQSATWQLGRDPTDARGHLCAALQGLVQQCRDVVSLLERAGGEGQSAPASLYARSTPTKGNDDER